MSKWHDRHLVNSRRAQAVCFGTVLIDYRTLFIMEGDRPSDFPDSLSELADYSEQKVYNENAHPSLLLKEATYASMHLLTSHYLHIKI